MWYSGGMKDLTGKVYGTLTVLSLYEVKQYKSLRNQQTKAYWSCECECGEMKIVRGEHLTSGRTVSCGANIHTERGAHLKTHGLSGTPEHKSWMYMRHRVLNPDAHHAKYYDGISYAHRWEKFENFLRDMGPKPTPQHELDRKDPFLPYCKENCRWATRKEQMQNTRRQYA